MFKSSADLFNLGLHVQIFRRSFQLVDPGSGQYKSIACCAGAVCDQEKTKYDNNIPVALSGKHFGISNYEPYCHAWGHSKIITPSAAQLPTGCLRMP
jgi:hypothetical protein